MSRSGYTDDCETINLYRHAVDCAMNGQRGQAFLKEMRDALDAMADKRLLTGELVQEDGCCAMGAVAIASGEGPRGHRHSVVWRGGHGMAHDPHPSRDGLDGEPDMFEVFTVLEPAAL